MEFRWLIGFYTIRWGPVLDRFTWVCGIHNVHIQILNYYFFDHMHKLYLRNMKSWVAFNIKTPLFMTKNMFIRRLSTTSKTLQ